MTAATLIDPETSTPLELMRWTREQFEAAVEKGAFEDDPRIELLDGYILAIPTQSPAHSVTIQKAAALLTGRYEPDCHVRTQMPISLDDFSSPEPDLAVVPSGIDDYAAAHPTRAVLLVEVSEATLAKDRGRKLRAYARNGMPDYWIVNLQGRQLEVHRDPFGESYGRIARIGADEEFHPGAHRRSLSRRSRRSSAATRRTISPLGGCAL